MNPISINAVFPGAVARGAEPGRVVQMMLSEWVPTFLRVYACDGTWAGLTVHRATGDLAQLLPGEYDDGLPLTRFDSTAADLTGDLLAAVGGQEPIYRAAMTVAVRHHPPVPGCEPGFWGRLIERNGEAKRVLFARLRIDWVDPQPQVRATFYFGGYPLTSLSPHLNTASPVSTATDTATVAENREFLLTRFQALRTLLEPIAGRPEWEMNFNEAYPVEDQEPLRLWYHRLAESE